MKTLPGSRRERGEQVELHRGEGPRGPVHAHGALRGIDDETADLDARRAPGTGRPACAPERRDRRSTERTRAASSRGLNGFTT